jgi:putative SOS response-associated peptidase YedK
VQVVFPYQGPRAAVRDWFRARHDRTGNLPLFPGIFPGQMAPIVRTGSDGERELVMARWGMPGPPHYRGAPVTNRNVSSPLWRGGKAEETAASFRQRRVASTRGHQAAQDPNWFALSEDRPLSGCPTRLSTEADAGGRR